MTTTVTATATGLARSCHPGPTLAVTALAALLALAFSTGLGVGALLVLSVFSGQLVIGWSNDVLDLRRDQHDGRRDKPLATGEVSAPAVLGALAGAGGVCLVTSLALGWRPGVLHLVGLVGSGLAYNLGVKATAASFVPYAIAFGSLPAVVWLAATTPGAAGEAGMAPAWMISVGALLGVAAHLLNALPDLSQDLAHGIRGLPHRLGPSWTRRLAPLLMLAAIAISVAGVGGGTRWWGWAVMALGAGLAVLASRGRGAAPFRAAVAMALLTASLLVVTSRLTGVG